MPFPWDEPVEGDGGEITMPPLDVSSEPAEPLMPFPWDEPVEGDGGEITMPPLDVSSEPAEITMPPLDLREGAEPEPEQWPPPEWLEGVPAPPAEPAPVPTAEETAAEYRGSPVPESVWVPEATRQEVTRLESLTPEQLAAEETKRAVADQLRLREEWDRNEAEMRANQERHDAAMEEVRGRLRRAEDAARQLSEAGVDNDHWWGSRSTGQRIAAIWQAGIGGLLAPFHGGRNFGTEAIDQEINRDLEAQFGNLRNRLGALQEQRGILGQMADVVGSEYQAREAVRLAAWGNVEQRLAAEQARFDPAGTAARRILQMRLEAQQKMQDAQFKLRKQAFDEYKDITTIDVSRERIAAEERASRRAAGVQRAGQKEEMIRAGYRLENGRWVPHPELAPQNARQEKLIQEIDFGVRGTELNELDRKTGKVVGTFAHAKTPEDGKDLKDRLGGWRSFRTTSARLADVIKRAGGRMYKGPGSSRFQNEFRSQFDTIKYALAVQYAKVLDPGSVVREKEAELAEKYMPVINGFFEEKNPDVTYRALVKTVDDMLESHLQEKTIDYDPATGPIRPFQIDDEVLLRGGQVPAIESEKETVPKGAEAYGLPGFEKEIELYPQGPRVGPGGTREPVK